MTPAQREIWIAVDANGIPTGAAYATEGSAGVAATALGQSVPQYGPYRVQKYVTQDRLDFSWAWYASRWERLDQLVREEATDEFKVRWFNVMANGTAEVTEPPSFASLLNKARYDTDRQQKRAEKAEAALAAMLSGVDRGSTEVVGTVMQAIIGALQTEDGAAAVRYCGHLENLLKAAREANRVQHENFAAACTALGLLPEGETRDSFTLRELCEQHANK